MYNQQHRLFHGADRVPPLLTLNDSIFPKPDVGIIEYEGRCGKAYAIMFNPIRCVLPRVPLESHLLYKLYHALFFD